MSQKLVIDADPGIGSAVAISLAIADPSLDVLAVTAVAGRVSARKASRNVQAIVEKLDPPKWPRLGESDTELPLGNLSFDNEAPGLRNLNGPTGLGDWDFSVAELHNCHESARLLVDLVRSEPNEITLLTFGPLTNVEMACQLAPDFLSQLGGLVCVGGCLDRAGDVSPVAEFNMYANPLAARQVLTSPATKTLVPLDVTGSVVLTYEQFDRVPDGPAPLHRLLHQIVPFSFRAHHETLGLEGIPLTEVAGLTAVAEPSLCESRRVALDIECRGELTRGMTVLDRRRVPQWQPNIDVITSVDAAGVLDYLLRIAR